MEPCISFEANFLYIQNIFISKYVQYINVYPAPLFNINLLSTYLLVGKVFKLIQHKPKNIHFFSFSHTNIIMVCTKMFQARERVLWSITIGNNASENRLCAMSHTLRKSLNKVSSTYFTLLI